ncbi:MAG TPA: helix-turn-helix domain-containing protein, partial [Polyangiaceae bacterium]|nr:helix-turn-helix domain-containing protein [Polyangiaceae bacterium]
KLRSGNIVSAYILKESGPRPEDKVPVYAPMRVLNNPGAILGLVCKEGDGRVDEVFRDALQRACRAYEQAIEETRPAKRRTAVLAEVEAAKERRRQILALSQAEAARLLGVQKPTIRRYIDAGKLKTLKRGKRELIVVIEPEAGDD